MNSASELTCAGMPPPCTCSTSESSIRTLCPLAMRPSTRCEPIKPAPPVTNMFIDSILSRGSRFCRRPLKDLHDLWRYHLSRISLLDRVTPRQPDLLPEARVMD